MPEWYRGAMKAEETDLFTLALDLVHDPGPRVMLIERLIEAAGCSTVRLLEAAARADALTRAFPLDENAADVASLLHVAAARASRTACEDQPSSLSDRLAAVTGQAHTSVVDAETLSADLERLRATAD